MEKLGQTQNLRRLLIIPILSFCLSLPAFAESNAALRREINDLKRKVAQLEARLNEYEANDQRTQKKLEKIEHSSPLGALDDIKISAGATFIAQSTVNANGDDLSGNGEDVTDASYSLDLGLEKEFGEFGKAVINFETGDGAGVNDELKLFSNVNKDADDSDNSLTLTKVWYEHYFKSLPLTVTAGKIGPTSYLDTNQYANDECTQFLGEMFKNSPAMELPGDSAGIRLAVEPADFLAVDLAMFDADSDWEDAFNDMFFGAQINLKHRLFNRPGNYRLITWVNDRQHTQWNNNTKTQKHNYGFGLSFDQELTDNLGAFVRYAWQNPKVYLNGSDFSLEQSWSMGLQLGGSLWQRGKDAVGAAFGQIIPSDDYKKTNNLKADTERHLEVYYSFNVNDNLTLSPDIQIIWDAYGGDAANGDETIIVGGLRSQIDF